jgi:hypothetical protein
LRRFIAERPHLRLHLPKYDPEELRGLAPLPLFNIVSLKIARSRKAQVFENDPFFKSCMNLETLECEAPTEFPDCSSTAEIFPRLRDLALVPARVRRPRHMSSELSSDVSLKWDIARLQSLDISLPCLKKLLDRKEYKDFVRLRRFKVREAKDCYRLEGERQSFADSLRALLNAMYDLEKLEVDCAEGTIRMSSIAQNKSLRVLKLYQLYRLPLTPGLNLDSYSELRASLIRAELGMLQRDCPLITELDITIERKCCMVSVRHCPFLSILTLLNSHLQNSQFLDMINQFRNLRSLTLRTRASRTDGGDDREDQALGRKAVSYLKSLSRTIPFQELEVIFW